MSLVPTKDIDIALTISSTTTSAVGSATLGTFLRPFLVRLVNLRMHCFWNYVWTTVGCMPPFPPEQE